MAEVLKAELHIEAELLPGDRGIFEVAVDGAVVARKTIDGFPSPEQVVEAVRAAV